MSDDTSQARKIGSLMIEHAALEKQIGELRDRAAEIARTLSRASRLLNFQPERLCFESETLAREFAGENPLNSRDLDIERIAALAVDLRAAIRAKSSIRGRMAEVGLDLEALEDEELQRKSRALHCGSGAPENKNGKPIGFIATDRPRRM